MALDLLASSTLTRERMGWEPTQPDLIHDLEQGHYFRAPGAAGDGSPEPASASRPG